jgi:adenine-specific DNA-methyltransferase
MEKLKMHSPNFVEENIKRLAGLFPNCVTETRGENGGLKRTIDFDLLRQELSVNIVEGPQERYHLNWPGKREALLTANAPIAKTLRPCREESVDFDTTQNLFIEGDNLDALKLLQETYLGKVKMIYIDPPYNTGNDFIYEDDFAETAEDYLKKSNQKDEHGNRLVANTDSNGRFHSDWLSMIYSRIKLAKNLLRDDGIIFISIDDNEAHNLRKICDELFGIENLFGIFQWRRRQRADNRNQSRVSPDHEYIVAYSKSGTATLKGTEINLNKYSNPDNDHRGPWASIDLSGLATATQRPNLHYDIVDPNTGISYPPNPGRGWSKSKENVLKMIEEGRILFPKSPSGRPREKKFVKDIQSNVTGFSTCLDSKVVGYTSNGTREVNELIGGKFFDFPKPVNLLKDILIQAIDFNDIILDFFSGSATTAHAVMQLNAEDNGSRRFIMIQLPEPCDEKSEAFKAGYKTIAEIGKERIRRAGKKIKEENPLTTLNLDTGFRVLKVDSSNMADVYYAPDDTEQTQLSLLTDNIKDDRTSEDLLFQVLLDWGVNLSLPITKEIIAGREVFFVDGSALAACFEKHGRITEDFCKELAGREPLRVVFRDSGFKDDSVKINVEQIFKLMSPHTDVKTI